MAKNFIQNGDILTLAAPYTVTSGQGAQVGSIFGVALTDISNTVPGEFAVEGVWDLTALGTCTGAQGAKVYWDNVNKRCDTDSTVGMLIGALTEAKANGQTTVRVNLNEAVPDELRGTLAAVADLTGTLTGTVNGALVDVAAAAGACAGGATPSAANVDAAIATAVAPIVTGVNEQNKEFQTKLNALLAELRTAGIIAP